MKPSNKTLLIREAEAFDNIVSKRIRAGFIPDIKLKKKFNFFKNNPWKYPKTQQVSIKEKINFVLQNTKVKSSCLEIGSGLGTLCFELARNNRYVTGIDLSKKSVEFAKNYIKTNKKLNANCKFSLCSFEDFRSFKKYDNIIFFKTLHHIPNLKFLFNKAHKLLKKNGKIIIVEPLRDNFKINNAIICYLIKLLFKKKVIKSSVRSMTSDIEKIYLENLYLDKNEKKQQSPMDNVSNVEINIIKELKKKFVIKKINYTDAIKDKLIGELTKNQLNDELKFIVNLEKYLIKNNILKGLTVQVVANKKI